EHPRAGGVAARDSAPAVFIAAGPATTLGGAVIQSLVLANWRGMTSKADFEQLQAQAPLVAAMGNSAQREWVAGRA
ncbi:MAG: ACP S-malonyltransferase, partial [Pseudomonadota bacterium]|nr:ACP S-malonyltransferase [Pseudomonadota bacterium]